MEGKKSDQCEWVGYKLMKNQRDCPRSKLLCCSSCEGQAEQGMERERGRGGEKATNKGEKRGWSQKLAPRRAGEGEDIRGEERRGKEVSKGHQRGGWSNRTGRGRIRESKRGRDRFEGEEQRHSRLHTLLQM
eukprot:6199956-Pleurochrysis_carterae.AAC.3